MDIRPVTPADHAAILKIADALPDWFAPAARPGFAGDLKRLRGYVTLEDDLVGFLSFALRDGVAHVLYVGVLPERQRVGVGRALVNWLEFHMREEGALALEAVTPGYGIERDPYLRSRWFFQSCGFEHLRVEPSGNPDCPESLVLRTDLSGEQAS